MENTTKAAPVKKTRAKKVKTLEASLQSTALAHEPIFGGKTISNKTELFEWKKLIPSKYVEISHSWYSQEGIDIKEQTDEQKEELKERCGEENLIIKLAGFKHLAHLRGFSSVSYRIDHVSPEHVSATCEINFDEVTVENEDGSKTFYPSLTAVGVANATAINTSYPFSMFLESMAENRSFIRAVKTAFNINILGAEELQTQPQPNTLIEGDEGCTTPQESLRKLVSSKGKGFADLYESLKKKKFEGFKDWTDFKDIPSEKCVEIINSIISKN